MTNKKKCFTTAAIKRSLFFLQLKKGDTAYHTVYIRVHLSKNVFKITKFFKP